MDLSGTLGPRRSCLASHVRRGEHSPDRSIARLDSRDSFAQGVARPYRIERVAEVGPASRSVEFASRSLAYPIGQVWLVPTRINIVQYSCTNGQPLPPLSLVDAFDIAPAAIVMSVDRQLRTTFEASEHTRECIRQRKLSLSPYAFGPASDSSEGAALEAIGKQFSRLGKYQRYECTQIPQLPHLHKCAPIPCDP